MISLFLQTPLPLPSALGTARGSARGRRPEGGQRVPRAGQPPSPGPQGASTVSTALRAAGFGIAWERTRKRGAQLMRPGCVGLGGRQPGAGVLASPTQRLRAALAWVPRPGCAPAGLPQSMDRGRSWRVRSRHPSSPPSASTPPPVPKEPFGLTGHPRAPSRRHPRGDWKTRCAGPRVWTPVEKWRRERKVFL